MFAYSNSQVNQDLFVLCVLNGKRNGTYVEIGANEAINLSNTFLLETKFGWRGVSFEMSPPLVDAFNRTRRNVCIRADATGVDYTNVLRLGGFSNHIDYLQVDIEPAYNTLKALKLVDFDRFTFSVVTYEHDAYQGGHEERRESRRFLEGYGYTRVVSDVRNGADSFEDWWVKEDALENDNWKLFRGSDVAMDTANLSSKMRNSFEKLFKKIEF